MILFGPSMGAILVGAHVVQSHFLFGTTCLRLEEDRFTMIALWAGVLFGAWQCWVGDDIGHNVGQFTVNWIALRSVFVLSEGRPEHQQNALNVLTRFRAWFCWRRCSWNRPLVYSRNCGRRTTAFSHLCPPSDTTCCCCKMEIAKKINRRQPKSMFARRIFTILGRNECRQSQVRRRVHRSQTFSPFHEQMHVFIEYSGSSFDETRLWLLIEFILIFKIEILWNRRARVTDANVITVFCICEKSETSKCGRLMWRWSRVRQITGALWSDSIMKDDGRYDMIWANWWLFRIHLIVFVRNKTGANPDEIAQAWNIRVERQRSTGQQKREKELCGKMSEHVRFDRQQRYGDVTGAFRPFFLRFINGKRTMKIDLSRSLES